MKKSTLKVIIVIMILLALTIIAAIILTFISQLKISPDTKAVISDLTDFPDKDKAEDEETDEADVTENDSDMITDDPSGDTSAVQDETADETPEEADALGETYTGPLKVVWLGDSLTQGSLGDDNNNENNPQAPWRVLMDLSGYDVEGFGYFGLYAHDILWKWGDEGGVKDKDTVYIFWVGSCDFRDSADNVSKVIDEIDTFLRNGYLDRYLVLGTTDRPELGREGAIKVNDAFRERYKDKYLDILEYVEYGPDNLHLTEASYHDIAEAVYDKLKSTYGTSSAGE